MAHNNGRVGKLTVRRVQKIFGNTYYNADCIAGSHHISDNSVDLLITDPPYGINGHKLHQHYNRDERFVVDGYIEVPVDQYNAFSKAWITQAERVLRPGGQLYIVSGYTNLFDILDALRQTRLVELNHLIWKYNFGVYTTRKFVSSHYHILYYAKPGGQRTFNLQCRFGAGEDGPEGGSANYADREDVWVINREYKPGTEKNKNELPRALLQKMIQYSSVEGDLVCDFFMGGCSTAAVAVGLNRRFIGFEKSPSIFASRVPQMRNVRPGSLLQTLRTPPVTQIENQGKEWTADEATRVLRRLSELEAKERSKKDIIASLSSEFKRGRWSIEKLLKREGVKVRIQNRRTPKPVLTDPSLFEI